MLNQAVEYAKRNQERHLAELKEFVSIPSISTLSAHKPDMRRAGMGRQANARDRPEECCCHAHGGASGRLRRMA